MHPVQILRVFATVLAIAAAPVAIAGWPGGAAAAEDDPVVAIVSGVEIRRSEVVEIQQALPQQYRAVPLEQVFPVLIERLIDLHIVAVEGRRANLQNDAEVKRRMGQIEDRVIREVYITRHVESTVTEEMLRDRYAEFTAQNPPQEEIRARHILVESEEAARALLDQINGGADFAETARVQSIGPSAPRGGDLGYFTRETMVPEFAEAAFSLQSGEVSPAPVRTSFGWHVIKVEDRRLAAQPAFDEMRDQLAAEVSEIVATELIENLRAGAAIERFNLDGTPLGETPVPTGD